MSKGLMVQKKPNLQDKNVYKNKKIKNKNKNQG